MGAHTLGNANQQTLGYAGTWIFGDVGLFDNKFYRFLVDNSLTYENDVNKD